MLGKITLILNENGTVETKFEGKIELHNFSGVQFALRNDYNNKYLLGLEMEEREVARKKVEEKALAAKKLAEVPKVVEPAKVLVKK